MPRYYAHDVDTGDYRGWVESDGAGIMPDNYLTVGPDLSQDYERVHWDGSEWVYVTPPEDGETESP